MKTILVDDEPLAMDFFYLECENVREIEVVGRFDSPLKALEYAGNNQVDLAVLDIEMPEMNGIELGSRLKEINKEMILIFITAHDEYARDAYNLHAPVYVEKPYKKEDVLYAINTARLLYGAHSRSVYIRSFGNFELYKNEKQIHISNKKAKELLAYLVDRKGSAVTNGEAISVLWPEATMDIRYQSRLRRVMKDLRDVLVKEGLENILVSHTNSRSVDTQTFECDYYMFLDGDTKARAAFNYEYMSQYSWGEETLGYLTRLKQEHDQ